MAADHVEEDDLLKRERFLSHEHVARQDGSLSKIFKLIVPNSEKLLCSINVLGPKASHEEKQFTSDCLLFLKNTSCLHTY